MKSELQRLRAEGSQTNVEEANGEEVQGSTAQERADGATPNDSFRKAKNPCVARTVDDVEEESEGMGKRSNEKQEDVNHGERGGSTNDEGDSSRAAKKKTKVPRKKGTGTTGSNKDGNGRPVSCS